jgi:hypothetical protein
MGSIFSLEGIIHIWHNYIHGFWSLVSNDKNIFYFEDPCRPWNDTLREQIMKKELIAKNSIKKSAVEGFQTWLHMSMEEREFTRRSCGSLLNKKKEEKLQIKHEKRSS